MPTPAEVSCRCSGCGAELWRERKGQWTLANRIVKLTPAGVVARCPDCATDVAVPRELLALLTDSTPTVPPGPRTRMLVRLDRSRAP